jgi:hypothetical protein
VNDHEDLGDAEAAAERARFVSNAPASWVIKGAVPDAATETDMLEFAAGQLTSCDVVRRTLGANSIRTRHVTRIAAHASRVEKMTDSVNWPQ